MKNKFEGNNSDFPCNNYIGKPVSEEELKNRLDKILKKTITRSKENNILQQIYENMAMDR